MPPARCREGPRPRVNPRPQRRAFHTSQGYASSSVPPAPSCSSPPSAPPPPPLPAPPLPVLPHPTPSCSVPSRCSPPPILLLPSRCSPTPPGAPLTPPPPRPAPPLPAVGSNPAAWPGPVHPSPPAEATTPWGDVVGDHVRGDPFRVLGVFPEGWRCAASLAACLSG